ncbi:MAG TPA: NADH-quinone oxidoreductase subunit C [Candidatus Eremiobacteraceae bacterium]|nr:NADH-quinone oxidoreductase subunit C [Candidatus Eremiobacteraceae bacterium]
MPDSVAPHAERASLVDLVASLRQAAGEDFLEAVAADDMDELALRPAGLQAVITRLREAGFNHLLDVGGTDHHPLTPRFEISYILTAMPLGDQRDPRRFAGLKRFRLRVFPDDLDPVVPTLSDLWPSANWPEREIFDLFGVVFDGHPELRRILNPDDWKGYPLRKDYPLRGFERRFVPGGHVGSVPKVRES